MIQNQNNQKQQNLEGSQQFKNTSSEVSQLYQQNYLSNINELISQPGVPSPTQYFLSTLYQLSLYLFRKKNKFINNSNNESFDHYLNSFSKQINQYDNIHRKAKISARRVKLQIEQSASQLLQCYERVPYAFFKQNFVLDFGQLAKNLDQIKRRQEKLNDDLDQVQINLFNQIHNKFHQYFNVVSNLEYVSQSLDINIQKSQQTRSRLKKVRVDFVEKSYTLKTKLTRKQSLQKTLKLLKIIKSLKKLPTIVKQILQSSLPYECLSLLKSTKQSLAQVHNLKCLYKVANTLKESESLVQLGLNKRYADQLYLYLQQCQNTNLQESWDRINSAGCVDEANSSMVGVSQILQESVLQMQPSSSKNKRNEGKQYEIALILIQSYRYIEFPAELMRIKIANSLRIFCKRFDSQLAQCLQKIIKQKNESILKKQHQDQQQQESHPQISKFSNPMEQQSMLSSLVQKVTVIFYVKHLLIFNEIMKDTLDRLLGYLFTLYTQYRQSKLKDQQKFLTLFRQQLSILPAIVKIIIQKLIKLMSLKNINGIGFTQFKQWIGILQYWKRYTDALIQENPLINFQFEDVEIEQVINEALRKMIEIFNINSTINELVLNYITVYHSNAINQELQPSFIEESWQPVEIPSQFVDMLNNIVQWHEPQVNPNTSITILNDSKDIKMTNKSMSQDLSISTKKAKFRVLKSNVMVDGVRYKISVSLLLLCQFIQQYVKMTRALPESMKFIYERMLDIAQYYNNRTKQLILQAKARQYQKMKSKNISAKHICLVHNCLSVLIKLVKQINYSQVNQLRSITIDNIQNHKNLLIGKLSYLLKSKIQAAVTMFLINKDQKVPQVNLNILNVFVQMMGIIDQFLQFQDKRAIFKDSMQIFMTKYFKQLLLKGSEYATENKIMVQKMRFLRQYFPDELQVMERQAKSMGNADKQI